MNSTPTSLTRRNAVTLLAAAFSLSSSLVQAATPSAPKVKFSTSEGDFVVEVYPDKAPKTVENFLRYVKDKHYDGTIFHRVINNFMIQGGGYDASYAEKKTRAPVAHEGREALAKGGPKNTVGTLAMARTNDPDSATAQFFINTKNNSFLNHTSESASGWGYAVFGKVIEGSDVVDAIEKVRTGNAGGHGDVPLEAVVIERAVEIVA